MQRPDKEFDNVSAKELVEQLAKLPPPTVSLLAPGATANAPISNTHVVGMQVIFGDQYTHPAPATTISFPELQTKLKTHYQATDKFIFRVFPNLPPFSIENSFINVSIVEKKKQEVKEQEGLKKQTQARDELFETYENIFKTEERIKIAPKDLFRDEKTKQAKRLLLIGRAGIGKSTLSQYLSYYWSNDEKFWNDHLQYVFKIKLRNLTPQRYTTSDNLSEIIVKECLNPLDKKQAEEYAQAVTKLLQTNSRNILFILDGYDEFNENEPPCARVIQDLLQTTEHHLLVTTRPFTDINKFKFDEILECLGFSDEDIDKFLREVCETETKREEILSFLEKNKAIKSLCHVPLILDMLCASWGIELAQAEDLTISDLYGHLVNQLWRNYGENRKKDADIQDLAKIEEETEIFLQELAFIAMQENKILLNKAFLQIVLAKVFPTARASTMPRYLKRLLDAGFLNSPDENSYYFPHLTFQEYFSAKYLEKHFLEPERQKWMMHEVYNPRYLLMWSFLSGLLRNTPNQLEIFFKIVESKFYELTKYIQTPSLMRIVEACNWELPEPRKSIFLKEILEEFENGFTSKPLIFHSFDNLEAYPHLLQQEYINKIFSQWLEPTHQYYAKFLEKLECTDISAFPTTIRDVVFSIWLAKLENADLGVKKEAINILGRQKNLSVEIISKLILLMESGSVEVKRVAANALGRQKNMPLNILIRLIVLLESGTAEVTYAASEAFKSQKTLPLEILSKLRVLLEIKDYSIKAATIGVLGLQEKLPADLLSKLVSLLESNDDFVKVQAIFALGDQKNLSPDVLSKLAALLEGEDDFIQKTCTLALRQQNNLPFDVLIKLAALLNSVNHELKNAAIGTLGTQKNLPPDILSRLVVGLESANDKIKTVTINALIEQNNLPPIIVLKLFTLLEDGNSDIKEAAGRALGSQKQLSPDILLRLGVLLESGNVEVSKQALSVLEKQTNLPEQLIYKFESWLVCKRDKDLYRAVWLLAKQVLIRPRSLDRLCSVLLIDGIEQQIEIANILNTTPETLYQMLKHLQTAIGTRDRLVQIREEFVKTILPNAPSTTAPHASHFASVKEKEGNTTRQAHTPTSTHP